MENPTGVDGLISHQNGHPSPVFADLRVSQLKQNAEFNDLLQQLDSPNGQMADGSSALLSGNSSNSVDSVEDVLMECENMLKEDTIHHEFRETTSKDPVENKGLGYGMSTVSVDQMDRSHIGSMNPVNPMSLMKSDSQKGLKRPRGWQSWGNHGYGENGPESATDEVKSASALQYGPKVVSAKPWHHLVSMDMRCHFLHRLAAAASPKTAPFTMLIASMEGKLITARNDEAEFYQSATSVVEYCQLLTKKIADTDQLVELVNKASQVLSVVKDLRSSLSHHPPTLFSASVRTRKNQAVQQLREQTKISTPESILREFSEKFTAGLDDSGQTFSQSDSPFQAKSDLISTQTSERQEAVDKQKVKSDNNLMESSQKSVVDAPPASPHIMTNAQAELLKVLQQPHSAQQHTQVAHLLRTNPQLMATFIKGFPALPPPHQAVTAGAVAKPPPQVSQMDQQPPARPGPAPYAWNTAMPSTSRKVSAETKLQALLQQPHSEQQQLQASQLLRNNPQLMAQHIKSVHGSSVAGNDVASSSLVAPPPLEQKKPQPAPVIGVAPTPSILETSPAQKQLLAVLMQPQNDQQQLQVSTLLRNNPHLMALFMKGVRGPSAAGNGSSSSATEAVQLAGSIGEEKKVPFPGQLEVLPQPQFNGSLANGSLVRPGNVDMDGSGSPQSAGDMQSIPPNNVHMSIKFSFGSS